jgi:hypothetical protein
VNFKWLRRASLVGALALLSAADALAGIRYVPSVYPTIQAAVTASHDLDAIEISAGVYTGAANCSIDLTGKSLIIRSASRMPDVVLDCAGVQTGFYQAYGKGTFIGLHIVNPSGQAIWKEHSLSLKNCVIDLSGSNQGVVLQDGDFSIQNTTISGGARGLYMGGAYPGTMTNVTIQNATVADVYFDGVEFSATNCHFLGCANGYGIEVGSRMIGAFKNCTFAGNKVGMLWTGEYGYSLFNCDFVNNSQDGLQTASGHDITRSRFSHNGRDGIHMLNDYDTNDLNVTDCDFVQNGANGLSALDANAVVLRCKFYGNGAAGVAATATNDYIRPLDLINSLCVLNGVGVTVENHVQARVTNCDIVYNVGAGMFVDPTEPFPGWVGYAPVVETTNSILYFNGGNDLQGAFATYSDIGTGNTAGTGNISLNPLFARAPSFGPDNTLGTADDDFGSLLLRATSPCINAGTSSVSNLPALDLRKMPRIQGGFPDMGAYEAPFALSRLSPKTAIAGSGNKTVIAEGSAFAPGATVLWNGSPLATTWVSNVKLTFVVPASRLTTPGTFTVTVRAPDSTMTNGLSFTVTP